MMTDGKRKPGPSKIEDFYDASIFSDLLSIFDHEYDPSELQENLSIAASSGGRPAEGRRRNLHIIHVALRDFIRRNCEGAEVLVTDINFQALDKNPDVQGMCQILAVFLMASLNSKDSQLSQSILSGMQDSDEGRVQLGKLLSIMEECQARIEQGAEAPEPSHDIPPAATSTHAAPAVEHEDDLAKEAEMVRLRRENDRYARLAADIKTKHDHLQDSYNELKSIHSETVAERDELQRELDSGASNSELLARTRRERDEKIRLIDSLEIQMEEMRMQKEAFEQLAKRLEAENKKLAPLFGENEDLKKINDDLAKKANTAEHLKQKLEIMRPLENEVQKLRSERAELYKEQEKIISSQKHLAQLKAENDNYAMKMRSYEIQESEYRDQRVGWTMQYQQLQRHAESLEAKAKHDEDMVKELQEKIMMLDPSSMPEETSYDAQPQAQAMSLEDELNGNTSSDISLKDLEVSRLQAENALLKASIGTETEKGQLLQQIETEQELRKALQQKYNDLFEKHTIEQSSLNALIDNMDAEGLVHTLQAALDVNRDLHILTADYIQSDAYSNMRQQILAEENRSKDLARKLEASQAEARDKERELLEARGDSKIIYMEYLMRQGVEADLETKANAISKEGQEVLAELKQTDNMLALSLRADLDALRKKYETLKCDFDAKQEQLVSALIDKEQLRKDAEAANNELQKAVDGKAVNPDVVKTTEKMEKLRTKYKKLNEVSSTSFGRPLSLEHAPSDSEDDGDYVKIKVKHNSSVLDHLGWKPTAIKTSQEGYPAYQPPPDGPFGRPKYPTRSFSGTGARAAGPLGGGVLRPGPGLPERGLQSGREPRIVREPRPVREALLARDPQSVVPPPNPKSSGWAGWFGIATR